MHTTPPSGTFPMFVVTEHHRKDAHSSFSERNPRFTLLINDLLLTFKLLVNFQWIFAECGIIPGMR